MVTCIKENVYENTFGKLINVKKISVSKYDKLIYKNPSSTEGTYEPTVVTARVRSTTGRYCFYRCLSVNIYGGVPGPDPGRGVPGPGPGGSQSQIWGGPRSRSRWGGPGLRSRGVPGPGPGGGVPGPGLGGSQFQIWGEGYPVSVKGKIFDTRFGLIHVQTGKKFFCQGTPPPGIARTCYGYAAGGMPLAFTQEDFLVHLLYYQILNTLTIGNICQIKYIHIHATIKAFAPNAKQAIQGLLPVVSCFLLPFQSHF